MFLCICLSILGVNLVFGVRFLVGNWLSELKLVIRKWEI